MTVRRFLARLIAPVAALLFALLVSSLALAASGNDPIDAYTSMAEYGSRTRTMVTIVNRSVPLYVSAVAVAIGLRMNLFNIGVEGQYRLAAIVAAAAGAAVSLPAVLHVPFILLVAMVTGGAWAGVAGVLKATRGIHEVISSIMLNTIATGLGAWLLTNWLRADRTDLNIKTEEIPASGRIPSLNGVVENLGVDVPRGAHLQGFLVGAIVLAVLFYVIIERTRFGFDLRASGLNPFAAQASGVAPKAMVVKAMVLSGAVAGLVGMAQLLGFFHRYTLDFPTGLGFEGIAVALLGRNRPVGMTFAALLFGFLGASAQVLDLEDVPKEIVDIMQGVTLLSVVVAYEVVRRLVAAAEARAAAEHERHADVPAGVPA